MKCLDGCPPVISSVFYFISPAPTQNIVPAFEPLEPTVAGFQFLFFPFVVARTFKFSVLLLFYIPHLWDSTAHCSSQLELSNKEAGELKMLIAML